MMNSDKLIEKYEERITLLRRAIVAKEAWSVLAEDDRLNNEMAAEFYAIAD